MCKKFFDIAVVQLVSRGPPLNTHKNLKYDITIKSLQALTYTSNNNSRLFICNKFMR